VNELAVLDTHTMLWYLDGHPRLSDRAARVLDRSTIQVWVPVIALAEALFILEKGRTDVSLSEVELLSRIAMDERFIVIPLDETIMALTLDCKAIPEMHDRQIVATAIMAQNAGFTVTLLTRDEAIRSANLVPTLW